MSTEEKGKRAAASAPKGDPEPEAPAADVQVHQWVTASWEVFNRPPETVLNALLHEGRTLDACLTKEDVEKAIDDFLNTDVTVSA